LTRPFETGSSSWQIVVSAVWLLLLVSSPRALATGREPAAPAGEAVARIQLSVDRLRAELGIPEAVVVSVLPDVALVVSVEAPDDSGGAFQLSIDERFLAELNNEELDAAVAHELGHVWVFTHHPYLQTEHLANQIAMRVVSRESLARVYQKVWERGGTKGDLVSFLGP
jgi:hypothetical protein